MTTIAKFNFIQSKGTKSFKNRKKKPKKQKTKQNKNKNKIKKPWRNLNENKRSCQVPFVTSQWLISVFYSAPLVRNIQEVLLHTNCRRHIGLLTLVQGPINMFLVVTLLWSIPWSSSRSIALITSVATAQTPSKFRTVPLSQRKSSNVELDTNS